MLMAIHSNTGSEYDLNEITTKGDDKLYAQMARALREMDLPVRSKRVISLPLEENRDLAETLYGYTQASREQLDKFLWIGTKRITKRRHRKKRGE